MDRDDSNDVVIRAGEASRREGLGHAVLRRSLMNAQRR